MANNASCSKLFGFSVSIHFSWVFLALLITWTLAVGFFPYWYPPKEYPSLSTPTFLGTGVAYWVMGLAGLLGLFVSIVLHELGHSLVARRHGIPMKGITLFIFGGVAEMSEEPPNAQAEFWMAKSHVSRLLVVNHGELCGIISLKDLLRFISLKVELED